VQRLCQLMDLSLKMNSVEGKGTTFRLIIPGGDPAQIKGSSRLSTAKFAKDRHILVIDDEPQVLQGMRYMLEAWGCKVMLAESARDALKIIALTNEVPELVVSDFRLKDGQNGIDAVAAIRESMDCLLPAIIISGDTSPERLKQVKETGLLFLHKPVSADNLYQHMHALLVQSLTKSEYDFSGKQSVAKQLLPATY